ncbi:hypothetical protein LLE49_04290 [Alicyclobacillus tolerans]|uniref:glycosyl hydrolase family 18 protein n=1 Tax=Alicyclobacillus tolerans TaxID=90970 RepID=UPI001F023180|nr:glycosyl hydrolase family 18 protein [Alicyclobacillus tolerans]MCF8563955.1 hypothetical protein [Alicyclobacillus tolerans]
MKVLKRESGRGKHRRTRKKGLHRRSARRLQIHTLVIVLAAAVPLTIGWFPVRAQTATYAVNEQARMEVNGSDFATVPGLVHQGTTFMPIWYVMQMLKSFGIQSLWNGSQWVINSNGTPEPTGFSTPAGTSIKQIDFNSQNIYTGVSIVYGGTTYLPVWYVMKGLTQIGVNSTWQGSVWNVVESRPQAAPRGPRVLTWVVDSLTSSYEDVRQHAGEINEWSTYSNNSIALQGAITGIMPKAPSALSGLKLPTYFTITDYQGSNFDGQLAQQVLSNPAAVHTLIANLTNEAIRMNYEGITVDFEMLPSSARSLFSQFVASLGESLHAAGKQLIVAVPAETSNTSEAWDRAYDYQAIGQSADQVVVMAYDYTFFGPAGPIAPVPWVDKVLRYAVQSMPAQKVILGLGTYGYDWAANNRMPKAESLPAVSAQEAQLSVSPSWNAQAQEPTFSYTDAQGVDHTVYYEDQRSIAAKLALAQQYHVGGIALWRIGLENAPVWSAISTYLQVSP